MARRNTLTLILVSTIIVTVITAFRVRDLPKNIQDSLKLELKKKCDDCEVTLDSVKVGQKFGGAKIESAKYEELKKAVREKQQQIHLNKKPNLNIVGIDSDEDDDGESLKRDYKENTQSETTFKNKKSFLSIQDDDDSDDDDEDRTEAITINVKPLRSNKNKVNKNINVDTDDESDDDDIAVEIGTLLKYHNKAPDAKKSSKVKNNQAANDDNGDDNDNDDNDAVDTKKKGLKSDDKTCNEKTKINLSKKTSDHNDDDEDNVDKHSNTKTITKTLDKSKVLTTKSKSIDSNKTIDDQDNDDEDLRKSTMKKSESDKATTSSSKEKTIDKTKEILNYDIDDDDSDDEDDDDNENYKIKHPISVKKTASKETVPNKKEKQDYTQSKTKTSSKSKDNHDEDMKDEKKRNVKDIHSKESKEKRKNEDKNYVKIVSKEYVNDDDDDDGDDDDSEEEGFFSGLFISKDKIKAIDEKSYEKSVSKEPVNDDNDDDEDSESAGLFSGLFGLKGKSETADKRSSEKSETKGFDNNYANDEDSESGGLFGGLLSSVTKLTELITDEETEEPETKKEETYQKKEVNKQVHSEKIKNKPADVPKKNESKTPELLKKDIKPPVKSSSDNKSTKKENKQEQPKSKTKEPEKKTKEPEKQKQAAKEVSKEKENTKKSEPKEKSKDSDSIPKKEKKVEPLEDKDSVLKEINEAVHRKNLLQSEFEDYYSFFPTFAPNFSRIHNPECRRHGQILLRQLRGTKIWALNMLDATAKIPSGILQGNGIQLGNFDQCLACRARVQLDTGSVVRIQGKYCLARLDVRAEDPELDAAVHLAQAKNLIRGKIDDPGHFVPRFSTLSWGVCVPSACGPEDVEVIIKDAVKHYHHKSGVALRVKVEEQDCQIDEDWFDDWFEVSTVLTLLFYSAILLLVVLATAKDYIAERKTDKTEENSDADQGKDGNEEGGEDRDAKSNENTDAEGESALAKEESGENLLKGGGFFSAFSLYHTLGKLLAPATSEDIACVHGVRGIATIALLVAHKFLPVAALPYSNRLQMTETLSSWVWSWGRAGWMYTDCFLLLSGLLTAHRITDSDGSALKRLLSRYLRLTPALLAVVLFYAYVWDNITTGPMWGELVTKNAEICQDGWWWNLFYVQNWFGFEEMCAPQTHQLALDMQLTILGGVLVWMVQLDHWAAWLVMPALHLLAVYSRYTTVLEHRLTLLAYHGVTVTQLYRTARLSYTSVLHRSTAYLIGLSLGMLLRKPAEHGMITRIIGWSTACVLWCLVWYAGIDSGSTTYHYSTTFAAQYAALAPLASALAIGWVIYAVQTGEPGFLSKLLCSWPLVLVSRLSYALYLCQFAVFFTTAATVRSSIEFTLLSLIDVQEICVILLSSVLLTLTFIIPMQSLHKLFKVSSNSENTEDQNQNEEPNEKQTVEKEVENESEDQTYLEEVNEPIIEEVIEVPIRKQHLIAHREILEEIPEVEVEYEMQRDIDGGLEEILEEEEDELLEEEIQNNIEEEELEVIEEEEGGEDADVDFWADREEYVPRRSFSRADGDDRELDEWEWTNGANGNHGQGSNGAQYYRYSK